MARAGDYARAGIAATNNTLNTLRAVRDNSPKYDEIQTEGMRQRANIKIAGLEAEGVVARAAINAEAKVRVEKARIDGQNARREGKRGVAKAGVVAAAGSLIGDAFKKPGPDPMKPFQADRTATEQLLQETGTKLQGDIDALTTKIESMKNGTYDYGFDDKPSGSGSGSNSDSDSGSGSGSIPSNSPSGQITATAEQQAAFKKIYDIAKGKTKFPEIVAAQAMHETGWLSPTLKSVYNSTGGMNPFGQTGDRGSGTITRAGDSNGWTKYNSLEEAVTDHITLWHDTKNHSGNYNAYNSISEGLRNVIPAYSPNSDPANKAGGFTENAYYNNTVKILNSMGYSVN